MRIDAKVSKLGIVSIEGEETFTLIWKRGPQESKSRDYTLSASKTRISPNYTFTKESTFYNTIKDGQKDWEQKDCSFVIMNGDTKVDEVPVNMANYISGEGQDKLMHTQKIEFLNHQYPGLYIEIQWLICEKSIYAQSRAELNAILDNEAIHQQKKIEQEALKIQNNMEGALAILINKKMEEQADEKLLEEIMDQEIHQMLENSESEHDKESENENYDNEDQVSEQSEHKSEKKSSSSEPEELTEPMVVDFGPKKDFDPNMYEEKSQEGEKAEDEQVEEPKNEKE